MTKVLYKEIASDGRLLSAKEQEGIVFCSNAIEASQEEIEQAKKQYLETGECKNHLFYDEPSFLYYLRYCGICGKFINCI